MVDEPMTLREAILYFSDPVNWREYLVKRRWRMESSAGGAICREKHGAPQFTRKTGTIMEDSPIGLNKWLKAMWQVVNCKNGISSYDVHRATGIRQKSAWFMESGSLSTGDTSTNCRVR